MHQPDYRDPATGRPIMPWVRLHACRGYRDVPWIIRQTGAQVTINLVPTLIEQIENYAAADGRGEDLHQQFAERAPDTLNAAERKWVLGNFFHGHPGSFRWFPAWGALRQRLGGADGGRAATDQDILDVQVWSQLAWFGFSAIADWPELAALRRKGAGFTADEKRHVLDIQRQILRGLRAQYRDLPELSASPACHPILPLLVDTAHAQRCMPGLPDPGFVYPEDARWQLREGRRAVGAWAGAGITGLWPSEGSVSPEVLELAAEAGFGWLATDQDIWERSARQGRAGAGGGAAFRGSWQAGGMRVLFRDRGLSDRIGFVYGGWEGGAAAADLLARLPEGPALLALDGENPWEGYADAGEAFLRAFLTRAPLHTCAAQAAEAPAGTIRRIHTGSWIRADFGIWIGQEEDRRAWSLLAAARAAWAAAGRPEAARASMMAAEGSDWFWWFGDDFSTPFALEFDRLFRLHLIAVYERSGLPVPEALHCPIKRQRLIGAAPTGPVGGPVGSGTWAEYARSGWVDLRSSAMAPLPGMPERLRYGWRGEEAVCWVEGGDAGTGEGGGLAEGWRLEGPEGQSAALAGGRGSVRGGQALSVVLVGPQGHRLPADGRLWLDAERPVIVDAQLGPIPAGGR